MSATSQIIQFDFEGVTIRVVMTFDQPWFVAADVCRALRIGNSCSAVSRLDDDERDVANLNAIDGGEVLRGNPNMNVINESGLYALVLTSRKPDVKRFYKWVTDEMMPQLICDGPSQAEMEKINEKRLIEQLEVENTLLRRHVEDRRAAQKKKKRKRVPLRYVTRACIPGEIISRAIRAISPPIWLVGPEIVKWLEPRIERLSDTSPLGRRQRWLLGAMIWLSEAPEDEFEAIEDQTVLETVGTGGDLSVWDLPLGTHRQFSRYQKSDRNTPAGARQENLEDEVLPRNHTVRGVR